MTELTRVRVAKNLPLKRYEGEQAIDALADRVRARWATPGKHQIYADKRNEAERFLVEAQSGTPDLSQYPYLSSETGITAETAVDLAQLWIFMDAQWKKVAAMIEQVTIGAKAQVRAASSGEAIKAIVEQTTATLDPIGEKPPERPKPAPVIPTVTTTPAVTE